MIKVYHRRAVCLLIALACLIGSCSKEPNGFTSDSIRDENYVDQAMATLIAIQFSKEVITNPIQKKNPINTKSTQGKTIKSSKPVKTKDGTNGFYIISYQEGGWAIVSADRRTPNILAFSETSSFNTDIVPSGVDEWLNSTKSEIEEMRTKNIKYQGQDKITISSRNNTPFKSSSQTVKIIPPPDDCQDTFEQVGPLLQTAWGQGGGYNNLMPTMPCTGTGRAYTGCVPTAMAQIIRYHQYPANWYNYAIMPNSVNSSNMFSSGTNEIAKIMHDAAVAVGAEYTCEGTGADTQEDVPAVLKNFFGYSSTAHYLDYSGTSNYSVVEAELRASRPVIFRGGRKSNWFIFPVYEDGHAWVSDGLMESFFCESGATYLFFHMNWGWDGMFEGWYGFNDFTPGDNTFNYQSGVVVGIKP